MVALRTKDNLPWTWTLKWHATTSDMGKGVFVFFGDL